MWCVGWPRRPAEWLAPGGHLLIEANERQAPAAAESFARNGLVPRIASSEEFGSTLVIGMVIGTGIGTEIGTVALTPRGSTTPFGRRIPLADNAEGRDRQLSLLVAAIELAAGAEVGQAGPGTLNGSLAPVLCAASAVK